MTAGAGAEGGGSLTSTQRAGLRAMAEGAVLIAAHNCPDAASIVGPTTLMSMSLEDCCVLDDLGYLRYSHAIANASVSEISEQGRAALSNGVCNDKN